MLLNSQVDDSSDKLIRLHNIRSRDKQITYCAAIIKVQQQLLNLKSHILCSEEHSFSIYYTSGADKLRLSQKNYVFQSKNRVYRSIESVYQIEKQSFSINCIFRSKYTVYRSINSIYQIEKQSFFDKLCFSIKKHSVSKNYAFR